MNAKVQNVLENLNALSEFTGAMPYETEGMEAVEAFRRLLRQNPDKYVNVCQDICQEMGDEDDSDEDDAEE